MRRRVMEDGRLGENAADFPPYPAWQVLLFCGPLEPLKAPDLFGQMFVESNNLKHRVLRRAVAHLFGGLAG